MELETVLIGVRGVMNLCTFIIIARYYDPAARYRPLVSIVATLIAAFSFSLAIWSVYALALPSCLCVTTSNRIQEMLLVGMFAILLGLVVRCKGNVAKMLPLRFQR
ncbi:hypothetical protein Psp6_00003 [Pseudomonas phage Psp6]|nr:hypothetical protein Psp6_00003 [Pseudomonas phage Psp6]